MPEQTRSIGYICPVCGNAVIAQRSAFQLAAGDSTLPCPCGKSQLSFRQKGDRCEITVPCLFCAKDHTAVCANDALLHQKQQPSPDAGQDRASSFWRSRASLEHTAV